MLMLTQNSVQRLLEGVAESLRVEVAPHVSDEFARMQLKAIDELLANLAPRVDWRVSELDQVNEEIERHLLRARELGWDGPGLDDERVEADGLRQHERLVGALLALLAWESEHAESDDGRTADLRRETDAFLRDQTVARARSLHSGMYQ